MDGRALLATLAQEISGSAEVDAAWSGSGPALTIRKACGLCGEDQPVRIPFLRHRCRGCAGTWVPGVCGTCTSTVLSFTTDGRLSQHAACGCGGLLRPTAVIPRQRVLVAPEVQEVRDRRLGRAHRALRVVLVVGCVAASVGAYGLMSASHAPASKPPATTTTSVVVPDSAALSPAERGRAAAARIAATGRSKDVFACTALRPAELVQDQDRSAFLASCLAG